MLFLIILVSLVVKHAINKENCHFYNIFTFIYTENIWTKLNVLYYAFALTFTRWEFRWIYFICFIMYSKLTALELCAQWVLKSDWYVLHTSCEIPISQIPFAYYYYYCYYYYSSSFSSTHCQFSLFAYSHTTKSELIKTTTNTKNTFIECTRVDWVTQRKSTKVSVRERNSHALIHGAVTCTNTFEAIHFIEMNVTTVHAIAPHHSSRLSCLFICFIVHSVCLFVHSVVRCCTHFMQQRFQCLCMCLLCFHLLRLSFLRAFVDWRAICTHYTWLRSVGMLKENNSAPSVCVALRKVDKRKDRSYYYGIKVIVNLNPFVLVLLVLVSVCVYTHATNNMCLYENTGVHHFDILWRTITFMMFVLVELMLLLVLVSVRLFVGYTHSAISHLFLM